MYLVRTFFVRAGFATRAQSFNRFGVGAHIFGATLVTAVMFCVALFHERIFSYPLDDTYIHMALAKTLASSGVWGVSPSFPAAASSSPLWTSLLAIAYELVPGASEVWQQSVPLLLNLAFAGALIWLNARVLWRMPGANFLLLLTWLFAALPGVVAVGMEHVAHTFLVAWFLVLASTRLSGGRDAEDAPRQDYLLLSVTALAATSRYESLFVIGPVVLLALKGRHFRLSILMTLAAALPLVAFGLLWVKGGGWMVPNSLLLKGAGHDMASTDLFARLMGVLSNVISNVKTPSAWAPLTLFAVNGVLLLRMKARSYRVWIFSVVTLTATVLHVCLASFGWLFRYDAWLIELNLLAIFMLLAQDPTALRRTSLVLMICLLALGGRFVSSYIKTPRAMEDRVWEHFMPSRFVRTALPGQTVLVNDLGVMAYFGEANVIDVFGLGSNEPVRWRRSPQGYQRAQLQELSQRFQGDVAIIQICWTEMRRRIPFDWELIGYWKGPRNVVFGDTVVAVFSPRPERAVGLRKAFNAFQPDDGVAAFAGEAVAPYNLGGAAQKTAWSLALCGQTEE